MGQPELTDFERTILTVIVDNGNDAYGLRILSGVDAATGRENVLSSIYSALAKMQETGLVTSRKGEATADRGWRPRQYFSVTDSGKNAINHVDN